jgi:hypothetical protein
MLIHGLHLTSSGQTPGRSTFSADMKGTFIFADNNEKVISWFN